ncbi:MAG: biosynthetic-type acetolactate synthase large subunit [Clostridia bacterium]|nr:biosynthetic-type acetolactate synthase large subunit [Clostridia bacterium]
MKAAEAIIRFLETKKVKMIFGYPGVATMPIYEAMRESNIEHILVRNEQASVHMASGYARISNETGVCISTSGPGATNLITGIATAYMDSIPLIVITGQVKLENLGKDVFQEVDITGATDPFTKYNYLVRTPDDLPQILSEAFYIASSGRPGPVLIDIPFDVQNSHIKYAYPEKVDIGGYKPTVQGHAGQIKRIIRRLKHAKRPVILIGGGVMLANARQSLMDFVELTGIPVVTTLMGISGFPEDSEYYAGFIGIHGYPYTPEVINRADVIMTIGARLSDRSTHNFSTISSIENLIHIDVDPAEIGKIAAHQIPIVGDADIILRQLIECAESLNTKDWLKEIESYKEIPKWSDADREEYVHPAYVMDVLSQAIDSDAIITADVGQNQIWTARHFPFKENRRFLISGGLGTMGYSVPAALGAKLAEPGKQVVAITGDGGIQMLLAELGTIADCGLPLIILLLNNRSLGLVRDIQEDVYGQEHDYGVKPKKFTDFVQIAKGFGMKGMRIEREADLPSVVKTAIEMKEPCLLECIIDPKAKTL